MVAAEIELGLELDMGRAAGAASVALKALATADGDSGPGSDVELLEVALEGCDGTLAPRHWLASRLHDRLAKAYQGRAMGLRGVDGYLQTPEGEREFIHCLRRHVVHTRSVLDATTAVLAPGDKQVAAALSRLAWGLKAVGADSAFEEYRAAAAEAVELYPRD
jgi:hypothetical protein